MSQEFLKRIISSIILIPIAIFFIIKGSIYFNFFISICFLITMHEWHMMTKKKLFHPLGFIFLTISFYSIYNLRNDFAGEYIYFLMITLICVSTDVGGYVFGKIFKGPKITKISPKKTYAGMIGGYVLTIIFLSIFFNSNYIFLNPTVLTTELIVFILLVSTVSQIGDILISYFKRLSNIKDTGKIIPGHGGLLDRFDGMIFAFPFSYVILKLNIFQYY